jgi:hypothetical protein
VDRIETKVRSVPWDVDRRLDELQLSREGLLRVVAVAMNESANATPFHPANAAGTFAYQHGTWSLRDQFVSEAWQEDRVDGVEAIRNDALRIKVAFSNVDIACNDLHQPKPRSKKGAGAERASGLDLFGDLPRFAPRPKGDGALYYLMVDENGAAELSRPVVKGGTFVASVERIYLSTDGDEEPNLKSDDERNNEFDPEVARK